MISAIVLLVVEYMFIRQRLCLELEVLEVYGLAYSFIFMNIVTRLQVMHFATWHAALRMGINDIRIAHIWCSYRSHWMLLPLFNSP